MIQYEVQGKIGVVTGSSKQEVTLTIPASLDSYPIAKIESNSFQEQSKLKKVIIPGSIKVIGAYSFASCPNLKEVVIEEGVEVIEDWAFINCNIEHISLPKSIKSVGPNAFLGNMCKYDVDDFLKSRDQGKATRARTNYRAAVFPLGLLESKEAITNEIIESRSRYIDSQFEMIERGQMTQQQLDIPIQFNNDECLITYFTKNEVKGNISFEIAPESKTQLGVYSENDPDFLVLKINIVSDGKVLSNIFIKVPYAEEVKIQNNGTQMEKRDDTFYYFIPVKIKMLCYGNGNVSREFALNMFNEFMGKYDTELKNGLIRQEQYDEVKDTVDMKILEIVDGFLSQIDGAPLLTYSLSLLKHLQQDQEFEAHDDVNDYLFQMITTYYNELSDEASLEKICFEDPHKSLQYATAVSGMSLEELNKKYDVQLTDFAGVTITLEEARTYQNVFMDLETNYNLHAEFMLYIYKEMQRLNNLYSIQAFSA